MSLSTPVFANKTLEEFLKSPETKPASEYIDGKIYQKLMPQGEHSTLQSSLAESKIHLIASLRVGDEMNFWATTS